MYKVAVQSSSVGKKTEGQKDSLIQQTVLIIIANIYWVYAMCQTLF